MMSSRTPTSSVEPSVAGPRLVLLIVVLGLMLLGFVMIYSASSISAIIEDSNQTSYLTDQLLFAFVGVIAAFLLWKFIPYEFWTKSVVIWAVWGSAVFLLLATAIAGIAALGAQRWLIIGPISLQPAEFIKIALVLMGAYQFSNFRAGSGNVREFATSIIVLVVIPTMFLFVTQSDLGTTAIVFVGIMAVMWYGEVPLKTIFIVLLAAILFAIMATFTSSYRGDRLLFLNPWDDGEGGRGSGYQLVHSYYAISEGGVFGLGLGNSREKFLYLPESETDFIFSIICEELGLIGALVVIVVYLVLLWAGTRIARFASTDFGSMLAGSLVVMLVFQAFLNIGCAIGALPTTGKPLPFISSGGSSLIASLIMVGLILSVSEGSSHNEIAQRRRDKLRIISTRKKEKRS